MATRRPEPYRHPMKKTIDEVRGCLCKAAAAAAWWYACGLCAVSIGWASTMWATSVRERSCEAEIP